MKKNCKITEAQLKKIVCEKKYKSEAKPYSGIWFWTNLKSKVDWKVYFTKLKAKPVCNSREKITRKLNSL